MRFLSFVIGMGAGVAAAMLFAPRSGEETRQILSDKVEQGRRMAQDRASDLRDMANDAAQRGKDVLNDATQRGKDTLNRHRNAAAAAAQAATETYKRESQAS